MFNDKEINHENKRYQKIAFNREIPIEHVKEAKDFIYKNTDKLIFSVDNKLLSLCENNTQQPTLLMGLGAYYFEEINYEKE